MAATISQVADLIVTINPDEAEYVGTRAQLEAEGLIPDGLTFARPGAPVSWVAGDFRYFLLQRRPRGVKGPIDRWGVVVTLMPSDFDFWAKRRLATKRKALDDEIRRQTPAGRREQAAYMEAFFAAGDDIAFQAFKAIAIPDPTLRRAHLELST